MFDHDDWSVERGLLAANQEINAFRSAVSGKGFSAVAPLPSRTQQIFRADVGDIPCVLRVVNQVRPSVAAQHTNAFHRLARALSPERMSSPALLTQFAETHSGVPANTDIVVTECAPFIYVDGDKVSRETLQAIGGEQRHLGAVLSYLAHLPDHEVLRNFLINPDRDGDFPFWFIDLDFAFGATMSWGHGRPIFYPGGPLDYQVNGLPQDQPARVKELLGWIDALPGREIMRIFGLTAAKAADLQARCARVWRDGLAAAIARERFWGPGDRLPVRLKERAYAVAAKFVAVCRGFRI